MHDVYARNHRLHGFPQPERESTGELKLQVDCLEDKLNDILCQGEELQGKSVIAEVIKDYLELNVPPWFQNKCCKLLIC